jgi:hypothetical protein
LAKSRFTAGRVLPVVTAAASVKLNQSLDVNTVVDTKSERSPMVREIGVTCAELFWNWRDMADLDTRIAAALSATTLTLHNTKVAVDKLAIRVTEVRVGAESADSEG